MNRRIVIEELPHDRGFLVSANFEGAGPVGELRALEVTFSAHILGWTVTEMLKATKAKMADFIPAAPPTPTAVVANLDDHKPF